MNFEAPQDPSISDLYDKFVGNKNVLSWIKNIRIEKGDNDLQAICDDLGLYDRQQNESYTQSLPLKLAGITW